MIQILKPTNSEKIKKIMLDIRVDRYGIGLMLPKAAFFTVRMDSLSNITANILKQEMLSLGGDVAVSRDSLTGKTKKTDCLLIGNLSQFDRLNRKLKSQPFGLSGLSEDLAQALNNYRKKNFFWELPRYKLNLSQRTHIMGIINCTPDSFSGDGLCGSPDLIFEHAQQLVREGADIIDVGGESSRPQAKAVSLKVELRRVLPVVKMLAKKIKVPISVDTYKPEVAKAALESGAQIINDITGLRNPKMSGLIAKYGAGVVIMHMKGTPRNMQKNPNYVSLMNDICGYLNAAVSRAENAGIKKEKIVIDPGIGFGKTLNHNLEILNKLEQLKVLGFPILVGVSRKSFVGKLLNIATPAERIFGTLGASVLAAGVGAKILRTHDVRETKQALTIVDKINNI